MFTFLHAADIHLDSPLKNLAAHDGAPVEVIRSATRRAFVNLIQLAISEEVDFLLLAGDLYDGNWKDYNTGLFFIEQIRRLRQVGIRVFLVSGNHDAASKITRALRLPDNVVHFSSHNPQTMLLDDLDVAIHGQSYQRGTVNQNLVLQYPDAIPDLFNIGLLHTSLSGRPGHEPYAPCTKNDLINKEYEYWALGHIHQREEVSKDPWILFPGNLQGRHIRETGAKGATLVRVVNGRVKQVTAKELDVVRWGISQLDCQDISSEGELMDKTIECFEQEVEHAAGRPLMLRLELHGSCPFHQELLRDNRYWENSLRGLAIDVGELWLEKILFHTKSPLEIDRTLLTGSPLEHFFESVDEEATNFFDVQELQTLYNRLPAALLKNSPLIPDDPQAQRLLLDEIREILLAKILQQQSS